VGDEPSALFYDPINNKIYCANSGTYPSATGTTVTVIDGATDNVITTITVGSGPKAFAYNPQYNRVYVANYYGNTVSVIRDSMMGIQEIENCKLKIDNFSIYPNPAKTYFTVRLPQTANRITVKLYDVSGKIVKEAKIKKQETRISLEGIMNGIYFIQLDNETITKKLVITR
jgi:YVTN family beta-propeller protein